MKNIVLRSPWLAVVLAARVAVLAAGGGWALAASGRSSIHACAGKKNGALRLAARCGRKERTVVWSVQGPAGQAGQTGSRGLPGNPAPQGPGATALHFRDTPTASPPGTVIATAGPFTFSEQCQPGPGTVEAILKVTGSDPWRGYGTVTLKDFNGGGTATTYIFAPRLAAGASYALDDVTTYNAHALAQAVGFQLLDDSTGHVYEVSATVTADGFYSTCDGVGAAIPAS